MEPIGLIGGIGPESTIDHYRAMIGAYRQRQTDGRAKRLECRRLALFGTRFTMQGRFYSQVFKRSGLALVLPAETEQTCIHDKYMTELVQGTLRPEDARWVAGHCRAGSALTWR
jgi:aspartate/glutamate racemase